MKILHITALHLNPTSGVPVVLKQLTTNQNLVEGVTSRVLSLNANVDKMESPYFDFLGNQSIAEYLRKEMPDVAIIHSFFHGEYAKAAKELTRLRIPFLIEPHGSFGHMAMSKSHLKKVVANNTVFRSLIKDAKAFIFTNEAEKRDSVYRSPYEFVVPNGVVKEDVRKSVEKSDESIQKPVFYYLGRYDIHHKGIDYLLDALDLLEAQKEDLCLIFYGTGTKEEIQFVRSRIDRFQYLSVKEAGPIFGEEKKKALESANILILTSRYEGSPMTILDALTYGNPCVVTPGTNVADEIVDNKIGWTSDLNPEAIAECIIKARNDYICNGKQFYKNAKGYVVEHYSWDKITEASIIALRKVLNDQQVSEGQS